MDIPHTQLIDVMLEEYRHTVTRTMPDHNLRPARSVATPVRLTALRQRLSDVLRATADRLEPMGTQSPGKHLGVIPYPGEGAKTAC